MKTISLTVILLLVLVALTTVCFTPRAAVKDSGDASLTPLKVKSTRTVQGPQANSSTLANPQITNGKIYFDSNRDGTAQIYSMNPDGSGQTRLTNDSGIDADPSFSDQNQKIAFTSNRDGSLQIYKMNPDGTSQARLSNNTANDGSPAWSTNGQKIAFSSNRDGNYEIYSMNAD